MKADYLARARAIAKEIAKTSVKAAEDYLDKADLRFSTEFSK